MNLDQFEGKWEELKGQVRTKWSKITNDDIATIHGKKDQLLGKLQERYGFTEDQASRELKDFMKTCECGTEARTKGESRPKNGSHQSV